ncbi:MAG: SDR family NAD(P)-dependent oxidoreductase [Sulfobacillus sp.]
MNRNIVFGGGTGTGHAIALQFAEAGDDVVLLGRRATVLASAASAIDEAAGAHRATWIATDLASVSDVQAMLRRCTKDRRICE